MWRSSRPTARSTRRPQSRRKPRASTSKASCARCSDASVFRFADIPVVKPANASFVNAMLIARRQDIGLTTPDELLIALVRADRVFIWSAPAQAKVTVNPACEAVWNEAAARADKAAE